MAARSLVDLVRAKGFAIETVSGTTTGAALEAAARGYAARFARYPLGSGVLIDVASPVTGLALALGAWWAGLRVAFARTDSAYPVDRQAEVVDAAVVVQEPGAVARVPVLSPAELSGPPVSWAPRCAATDDALDVVTSGTTGAPKCVTWTHAALAANATALATAMDIRPGDRIWTCLFHGLPGVLCTVTLMAAAGGATAIPVAPGDPVAAARSIALSSPTVVYAVPEVYEVLARSPDADPRPAVRWWLSSSAQLAGSLFDQMYARWGALVRSFYCGSETGTVTFNGGADVAVVRDSVGHPLPGVEVELRPEPAGQLGGADPPVGRIVVRGGLTGRGYRRAGEVVEFPASGIVTGDRGRMAAGGAMYLVGRVDDRIHVGADVVDPAVVEAHIAALPGVHECLVVARPHPRWGHVLEARVVRRAGAAVTERDIILGCRARGLRSVWVPRAVTWIDAIPRTPAGKPDRGRSASTV